MPVQPTYPGVYIQELPSGVRTITGVATAITAFLGRAVRGPVAEPTTIFDYGEFERRFGGLHADCPMSYAVRDFFRNGGGEAVIVRLYRVGEAGAAGLTDDAITEARKIIDAALGAATLDDMKKQAQAKLEEARTALDTAQKAEEQAQDALALANVTRQQQQSKRARAENRLRAKAEELARVYAQEPFDKIDQTLVDRLKGELDALRNQLSTPLDVENRLRAKAEELAQAYAKKPFDQPTVDRLKGELDALRDELARTALAVPPVTTQETAVTTASQNLANTRATLPALVSIANRTVELIDEKQTGGGTADDAKGAIRAAFGEGGNLTDEKITKFLQDHAAEDGPATEGLARLEVGNTLQLQAISPGQWGNELRARVEAANPATVKEVAERYRLPPDDLFDLLVYDGETGATERFANLTVAPNSPRYVGAVLKQDSRLVHLSSAPGSKPVLSRVPRDEDERQKLWETDFSAGVSRVAGADGKLTPDDYTAGLNALARTDLFNLLCIPPDTRGGQTPKDVYADAMKFCFDRRAMLLVDPPPNWSNADDLISNPATKLSDDIKLSGDAARNAALFYPRVRQADPRREGQIDTFVPCGIVAGIMARTDASRGVWKAPAGIDAAMLGVDSLDVRLTDEQNGKLNPLGINCLRSFPIFGTIVWGARTLRGADAFADEYKYIPVRRTALYIEESLFRGLKWVVFEPNDEPLWAQIRMNVGAFMHNLFRQGAFQGTTPREAYLVKCDKETTTQNDINLGIVNVLVGFAPLKPAEFVILKIQQLAGQIDV